MECPRCQATEQEAYTCRAPDCQFPEKKPTRVKIKSSVELKEVLHGKTGTVVGIKEVSASPSNYYMYRVKLDEPVDLEMFLNKTEVNLPDTCFEEVK